MTDDSKRSASRKRLIIIVAMFFVPLILATVWFTQLPDGYRPSSTTNNGVFVDPIYRIQNFEQDTIKAKPLTGKALETVWTLVHLVDGECDAACSQALYDTRQIRIALGKDIDRVKRVAVISAGPQSAANQKMWASHPDMTFAIAAPGGLGAQLKAHGQGQSKDDTYLIDPLGNLMMRFPADLSPKLMMKDLHKLLKLSTIG